MATRDKDMMTQGRSGGSALFIYGTIIHSQMTTQTKSFCTDTQLHGHTAHASDNIVARAQAHISKNDLKKKKINGEISRGKK
jgi:hypothetical protein